MAKITDRSLLPALLREAVLSLCRQTMHSHRRFIVDGIVCVSLDNDSDDSWPPIVVSIHEQVSKGRGDDPPSSPQRLPSPLSDDPPSPPLRPASTKSPTEERDKRPVNRKAHILRRVQQDSEAEDSSSRPHHRSSAPPPPHQRSTSKEMATGLSKELDDTMDGHLSDPTPTVNRSVNRNSFGLFSQTGDKEKGWRGSVSSPASSDQSSSSPTLEEGSAVGRPGSASPEEDFSLTFPRPFLPSPSHSSFVSRVTRGRRADLSCRVCGLTMPSVYSLERHHRQKHVLFTCTHCLDAFTSSRALDMHVLHAHKAASSSPRNLSSLSRYYNRQRHVHLPQPRVKRSQEERCSFDSVFGKRQVDLKRNLLAHMIRNGYAGLGVLAPHTVNGSEFACSPCALTFVDPVTYTEHVQRHSQDPEFCQYRCCYCPEVLPSYQGFMLHQQAHALQLQPLYQPWGLSEQPRTPVEQHTIQFGTQPEHSDQHQEERDSNDTVPEHQADNLVKEETKCTAEKHTPADDDERMEEGDGEEERSSNRPRQSWCSECQVGFPDEDTLIQHIKDTHESFINRRSHNQQERSIVPGFEEHINHDMDTSVDPEDGHEIDALDEVETDQENEVGDDDTGASERTCHIRRDSDKAKKTGDDCSNLQSEGTLRSLPSGSEAVEQSSQSFQDSDSAASAVPRLSPSSPLSRSSPLRIIPLPLSPGLATASSGCYTEAKARSHITLVKPKDLVIGAEPYSPHSSKPPSAIALHGFPLPVAISVQDISPSSSQTKPTVKTMYSLLNGALQSGSYVRRSEPEPDVVKREPLSSDPEHHHRHFNKASSAALRMLLPRGGLSLSLPPPSQDLPTDYSMRRASSASPGSVSTTGRDSVRSHGSERTALTPTTTNSEAKFSARSPLCCPIQDCGEEYSSFSRLEEHCARGHRRYLCPYCGKSFTAKPNRDRHVRVHTGVKPYKCDLCSLAFYRGDDLKYHVTTKHPRDIEH